MESGFWSKLAKPIIGLSPMDGVTDHPFRHLTKKYGQPDVIYTEFATVEGFCRGVAKPLVDFLYDETQRPIVAQIYGTTPEYFRQTTIALCQLGFDGVDINMGCPAKSVSQSGAGAGLIKTPKLAQEIVKATKQGVIDWQSGQTVRDCPDLTNNICEIIEQRHQQLPKQYQAHDRIIPISVKTRVGYDQVITEDWLKYLLEVEPTAIALHGRTLRQAYTGFASWEEIGKAAQLIKQNNSNITFLGNGDVHSLEEALEKINQYQVDGILIGRASFGNPWLFLKNKPAITIQQRAALALEHSLLYEKTYQYDERYRFLPMRKHLTWYIKNFPNASDIRIELVKTENSVQVKEILQKYQLLVV